jgi:hypothetical protein
MLGLELAVDVSGHSIETKMAPPKKTNERAWDDDLFTKGNLFVNDYANPVKPRVKHNQGIDEPDVVDVEEGETDADDVHTEVISSPRYRLYMVQDLVSQLLNPSERLTMIQWILVGIAGMVLMTLLTCVAIAAQVGVI